MRGPRGAELPPGVRDPMTAAVDDEIDEHIKPAYKRLRDLVEHDALPHDARSRGSRACRTAQRATVRRTSSGRRKRSPTRSVSARSCGCGIARAALGDRFTLKEFHKHVLSQGAVPLTDSTRSSSTGLRNSSARSRGPDESKQAERLRYRG